MIDRALTLTQPWAGLVVLGIKRIENRSWKPPKELLGRRHAVHASRKVDEEVVKFLVDELGLVEHPLWRVTSAIVGSAIWHDVVSSVTGVEQFETRLEREVRDRNKFGDPVDEVAFKDQQRFWMGPHAHVLRENRHYATPIPTGGARSFWHLSSELRSKVADAEHAAVGP